MCKILLICSEIQRSDYSGPYNKEYKDKNGLPQRGMCAEGMSIGFYYIYHYMQSISRDGLETEGRTLKILLPKMSVNIYIYI